MPRNDHRPFATGPRALLSRAVLAGTLLCLSWIPHAGAVSDDLLDRAREHAAAAARRAFPEAEVTVRMVPLDPRLALQTCEDLTLDIPGDRVAGRVSVHARCRAPVNWGLYLTAQVGVVLPVVHVTGPVPRDTVLRRSDLTLEARNLGDLRDGYLTNVDDAVGMAARAILRADSVLYQRHLTAPKLVSKGDAITLAARHGHVRVTTEAIALTDGVYGEQIEVRNPRSNRVMTGWVTGPGTVSTRP